ncbi:hypothetical protein PG993_003227 [Apiospora rasikravindrae]|uniref:FAD-binding PCMH-type domain-containing protein n=1 Tax=Apiospora rasikravindrae TaxID=990691 RepID=A0ABR1TYZ1_9PEZI
MACSRAVEILSAAFPADRFALPGTEAYSVSNASYASKMESDISPGAIFLPESAEEVSKFVKVIGPIVQSGEVQFAIRGAGCQPLPGCANIQAGITLDLSRLVGAALDEEKGTVLIAAGERWDAVYRTVHHKGLAVTGGRSGNNGVGGLAFFDGQIDALVKELNKPDVSEETHIMISLFFADQFSKAIGVDGAMGLNQAYYTQEVEKPAVLKPFTNIQPQIDPLNSMQMTNLVRAAKEQAEQAMTGVRCAYMNTTVKADAPTLHAATEIFKPALEKVKSIDGMVFSFTMQPYPVSLLKRTAPAGGNVLGLDPADGPLVSILILLYWNKQSDDEVVLSTARGVIEAIDKDATAKGTLVPYKYLNYAFDFQDPIGSYGPENRKKLQEASRKYDPDGLFQKGVPGGFKLFS